MGKVVKAVAMVAGVALMVVPGGQLFGTGLLTSLGVGAAAAGSIISGLAMAGVTASLTLAATALGLGPKPPKQSPASADRLRASIDTRAYRKIVFGHTAAATDVRYQEFTGAKQEHLNSIIALASHELAGIEQIWFDEKLAWSAAGGVAGEFAGYLTVTPFMAGTPSNAVTITDSASWTAANSRMTGIAYLWLRYKLTGNSKKAESPFASSVPSRITTRVRGALMYDPRRDDTVSGGGAGSHRAGNQMTWSWVDADTGRNPALQLLWYLLGWRIQNPSTSAWKLAVGLGIPVVRIDLPSFIAAANLCDEPVTLAAGGSEPRYRSDGVFSEGDDPSLVIGNLLSAMNGTLRDAGGKLVLEVLHNDLGVATDLSASDVIGDFTWLQTPPIDQHYNVVRGRYVDASDAGLYQMVEYPDVTITSPDGIERSQQLDLPMVQSPGQAQRLAKQYLQRAQYPGTFAADFLASAWKCQVGSVVRLTFPALGFSAKLFRVIEHSIRLDGTCPMVLREEAAAIYAWDAEDAAAVTAAAPIAYDPLNDPFVQALGDAGEGVAGKDGLAVAFDPPGLRLPIDNAGAVTSYSGAAATLRIRTVGGLDVTSDFALSVDGNAAGLTVAISGAVVTITGGFDAADADVVQLRIKATGSGSYAGYEIYETLTAEKAIARAAYDFSSTANDRNALVPDAPTFTAGPTVVKTFPTGNVAVTATVNFPYSSDPAHKNNVDELWIGYYARTSAAAYTFGTDLAGEVWMQMQTSNIAGGVFAMPYLWDEPSHYYYTFAVKVVRRVHTDIAASGAITSPVAKTAPFLPNGQAAYDPPNRRDASTPPAPTVLTNGTALDHVLRTAGTADISFEWSLAAASWGTIDGYEVSWYSSTSASVYTPDTTPLAEQRQSILNPASMATVISGAASDIWHTFAVRSFRFVDKDIAASGRVFSAWVKAAGAGENPYRPSANVSFAGNVVGTIDSTAASSVRTWAGYAASGLYSDGSVRPDKVGTDAIVDLALVQSGWTSQSGNLHLSANDTFTSDMVKSLYRIGSRTVVDFTFLWSLSITNPVQGNNYSISVRGTARPMYGSYTYSPIYGESIKWQAPSASGTWYTEQRSSTFQFVFDGLVGLGYWEFGYVVTTPASNGALFPEYRYLKANDIRVAEA